jgi:hypothetical protein
MKAVITRLLHRFDRDVIERQIEEFERCTKIHEVTLTKFRVRSCEFVDPSLGCG